MNLQRNEYVLGIDLGLKNTCAAIMTSRTPAPIVVSYPGGSHFLKSCVQYGKPFNVGSLAYMHLTKGLPGVVKNSRRIIGRYYKDEVVQKCVKDHLCGAEIKEVNKKPVFVIDNTTLVSPSDVSSEIIKRVVEKADEFVKTAYGDEMKCTKIAVTFPAYFDNNQRTATLLAVEKAGISKERLTMINEPTAAAFYFCKSNKIDNQTILVYDLGDESFDVSIVRVKGDDYRVLKYAGNSFLGGADIDYLIYYTRAGNGNFGELDLLIATDEGHSNWTKYGTYNFRMQNAPSKISFKTTQKVTGIKFEVKSGAGNFVSCDEMEFYRYNQENTLENTLLTVFSDVTCSALKEGVTDEQINALPDYFIRLAKALQNNTYDPHEKEFRIREYAPYSIPEEWATKLMTKKYSNLDNPTGISVQQGDEIIVLVGDTHGQQISLQSIWESGEEYKQTNVSGEVYFLSPGINKLTMRKEGQLFVMYNTDLTSPDAQPVKIHIPMGSGKVTGFFDLKEHKTDEKYAELLKKATHKYFCVRGERIMFYFHTAKMQEFVPNQILSAINLWDDIIGWEQELMGIEDVRPSQVNNHIFAISPEGSYMWATDYCIGFVYTYLNNILLKENVMANKDNAWGPAHEIGHIHQAAINWPGSTESSNNLFSNYILYKLGKYCSRGSELNDLADSRFVRKKAWYNMGDATHQGEDTEIHMRMNWQLWNYYHRCGHNPKFWQTLFKLLREDRITESDPGGAQLKFAMKASEAAGEDLTDFFDLWGFFIPGEDTIEQYGTWKYKVTEAMIQEAKTFMKKFPKPKHAFQYIEDRKAGDTGLDTKPSDTGYYTQFEGEVKAVSPNIAYTVSGRKYTVENGENAVAFELRKNSAEGELVYFFNMFSYDIPAGVELGNAKLYAVQADGKRIEIPVKK